MGIVLPLRFADAIFVGREATTGNASAFCRLQRSLMGFITIPLKTIRFQGKQEVTHGV